MHTLDSMPLEDLCINTIRTLAMDAVQAANSGHPGTPMALAPLACVLWTKFLRYNPRQPQWSDRDRCVPSNGHASMLLYAMLYLTGYDVSSTTCNSFGSGEARHQDIRAWPDTGRRNHDRTPGPGRHDGCRHGHGRGASCRRIQSS